MQPCMWTRVCVVTWNEVVHVSTPNTFSEERDVFGDQQQRSEPVAVGAVDIQVVGPRLQGMAGNRALRPAMMCSDCLPDTS